MHIGIVSPLATKDIADILGNQVCTLPRGYIGAPLISTLIRTLLKRGHRVSAITTDTSLPICKPEGVTIRSGNLTVYYLPQRESAFMWRNGAWGRAWDLFSLERQALVRAIRVCSPDVIHAHWSYEFAWAAIDSGFPHLVTAHDSPSHVLRQSLSIYRAVRYVMARYVYSKVSNVTAVSPFVRDAIQPWVKNTVHVVGNPLSADEKAPPERKKTPWQTQPDVSMVINGWQRLKNPENAFRGFHVLRERLPNASLHAYGNDFGKGQKAEQWCRSQGLAENCHFHGHLPFQELQAAIANSDVLLHTSRLESCPMGILEAMSAGIPIVGGESSGGVPWVVGDAGLLTDVENPTMIADALYHLLTDTALYARCSGAALSRSRVDFSADTITDMYEALYARASSQGEAVLGDSPKNQRSVV